MDWHSSDFRRTLDHVIEFGWLFAKAGTLLIILCVVLKIILGDSAGTFVSTVSFNATSFLQGLPAGTIVGLALVGLAYELLKSSYGR